MNISFLIIFLSVLSDHSTLDIEFCLACATADLSRKDGMRHCLNIFCPLESEVNLAYPYGIMISVLDKGCYPYFWISWRIRWLLR